MFCTNCGAKLKESDQFCSNCGNAVGQVNSTKNDTYITQEVKDQKNNSYTTQEVEIGNQEAKKPKIPKKVLFTAIPVSVLLILILVLSLTVFNNKDKKVQKQLDNGEKYLAEENYDKAVEAFLIAQDLSPENIDAHLGLAEAYQKLEKYTEAIAVLENALEIAEDNDKSLGVLRKIKEKLMAVTALKEFVTATRTDSNSTEETAPYIEEPTPTPIEVNETMPVTDESIRDLYGTDITLADWYTDEQEPITAYKQDRNDHRNSIQNIYNFSLSKNYISTYDTYFDTFLTSVLAGNSYDIYTLSPDMFASALNTGVLYPLNYIPSFDFTNEMWNKNVFDTFTFAGNTYAFSPERPKPGLGLYYNKSLLARAGYYHDYIYDLQSSGEWTWDKLEEILLGYNLTDGLSGKTVNIIKAAVISNGTDFVKYDTSVVDYVDNQEDPDFIDALEFYLHLLEYDFILTDSEELNEEYHMNAFIGGETLFYVGDWSNSSSIQENMEDEWGFVFFPEGPGLNARLQTISTDKVYIIPISLDESRADDVAFAFSQWASTVPGYEDDSYNTYEEVFWTARDTNMIEETLLPMMNGHSVYSFSNMVWGFNSFLNSYYNNPLHFDFSYPAEDIANNAAMEASGLFSEY